MGVCIAFAQYHLLGLNFFDFYIVLERTPDAIKGDPKKFYLYKLYPIISVIGVGFFRNWQYIKL
jgi:hypothetical protein